MLARCQTSRKSPARRGSATMELLLLTPIFMLTATGMIGLADLCITDQLIFDAACRGGRTAALGGSQEQVEESIRALLGPERTRHATITVGPADGSTDPVPPGGLIEVRIEIEAGAATATGLAPLGSSELLIGRTVIQRE